jgi:hypothetical protein
VALALLLEGSQALTPDRRADLNAALIGAGGAMAAVLPADLFIQGPRRLSGRAPLRLARMRLLWPHAPVGIAGIGSIGLGNCSRA